MLHNITSGGSQQYIRTMDSSEVHGAERGAPRSAEAASALLNIVRIWLLTLVYQMLTKFICFLDARCCIAARPALYSCFVVPHGHTEALFPPSGPVQFSLLHIRTVIFLRFT